MLALIFTAKALPMIIGSLSGWLWLAGITARPRATSSRTSSAGTPSRAAMNAISAVISPARARCNCVPRSRTTPGRGGSPACRSITACGIGVRARRVVEVEVLAVGQVHPPKRHPRLESVDLGAARDRAGGDSDGCGQRSDSVIDHLPTPALPGQVRTVDGPSCPLSALGVRSRVCGQYAG